MTTDLIAVASIGAPRGVKGEVRIKSFTQHPDDIAAYGPLSDESGNRHFTICITGHAKGMITAKISGIDTRDQADALKGTLLYLEKDKLPEPEDDEFYHHDLIGLEAVDDQGNTLGHISAVENFGASDVLELSGGPHGTLMVPFTHAVVPVVDIENKRIVIQVPDGLLDPSDTEDEDNNEVKNEDKNKDVTE